MLVCPQVCGSVEFGPTNPTSRQLDNQKAIGVVFIVIFRLWFNYRIYCGLLTGINSEEISQMILNGVFFACVPTRWIESIQLIHQLVYERLMGREEEGGGGGVMQRVVSQKNATKKKCYVEENGGGHRGHWFIWIWFDFFLFDDFEVFPPSTRSFRG